MLIPVSWLRDYIKTDLSAESIGHILMMAGFEVDAIRNISGEQVIELSITANRIDCLSMIGIAREIAAFTGATLTIPVAEVQESEDRLDEHMSVQVDVPELCGRYVGRAVTHIRVGDSPLWLRERLVAAGLPTINNIVDVTNYAMWELGQPLHAFDLNKLAGRTVVVRRSNAGERITTIDHQERVLPNDSIVVCDSDLPIAIAGIMGGVGTEVGGTTTDVFIESAQFNPASIRRAVRFLALSTDSSYRFQRNIDPSNCLTAADRAAGLIAQIAGGIILGGALDFYPSPIAPLSIELRTRRVNKVLGTELSTEEIKAFLIRLGFNVTKSVQESEQLLQVTVPTRRRDIEREADLIEEIARLYGYDNIPITLSGGGLTGSSQSIARHTLRVIRDVLLHCGLNEILTFSLTQRTELEKCGLLDIDSVRTKTVVEIRNPISREYDIMRISLLPSLLDVLSHNARNGVADVNVFDLGKVYLSMENEQLPREVQRVGIAMMGTNWRNAWNLAPDAVIADFFKLKGVIEEILSTLHIDDCEFRTAFHPTFQEGRTAELWVHGTRVGILGEIGEKIHKGYDLRARHRAYAAELDFDVISAHAQLKPEFVPLPRFQAVERDIALLVADEMPASEVEKAIREAGGSLLTEINLFDFYKGTNLAPGVKSLAYRLTFRHEERTLEGTEVEKSLELIRSKLENQIGAGIRLH